MKILAAIVTYNRMKLLQRCITKIQEQTRSADDILIINNSSTDGTQKFLSTNNFNHINQKNSGSAGGWFTAINYAISNNFDLIWLMDDDGYPDINSLNLLSNHFNKKYSCVSSIVVDTDSKSELVFPMPVLNNKSLPKIISFKRKIYNSNDLNKYCNDKKEYFFCHLFNGALISLKHIKKIGNINTKYFMYGDEVDYYFRLRSVGKVVSLVNSYHYHPNVQNRSLSNIKLYYYIKNSIILNYKYFDYSFIRSSLNIIIGIFRYVSRNGMKSLLVLLTPKNLRNIIVSIYRGFKLKIDADYEK